MERTPTRIKRAFRKLTVRRKRINDWMSTHWCILILKRFLDNGEMEKTNAPFNFSLSHKSSCTAVDATTFQKESLSWISVVFFRSHVLQKPKNTQEDCNRKTETGIADWKDWKEDKITLFFLLLIAQSKEQMLKSVSCTGSWSLYNI